jgi:hypothetical protein
MMHAAPRGIAGADGGLERSSCQPRIDRAADDITYDPTGPRIEGDSHVHEAGRDPMISPNTPLTSHLICFNLIDAGLVRDGVAFD